MRGNDPCSCRACALAVQRAGFELGQAPDFEQTIPRGGAKGAAMDDVTHLHDRLASSAVLGVMGDASR